MWPTPYLVPCACVFFPVTPPSTEEDFKKNIDKLAAIEHFNLNHFLEILDVSLQQLCQENTTRGMYVSIS